MSHWTDSLKAVASKLEGGRAQIPEAAELFKVLAGTSPDELVTELASGTLDRLIQDMDTTSVILAKDIATSLQVDFEDESRFKEAAALSLVFDRLQDQEGRLS